jgi:hypothetical protein
LFLTRIDAQAGVGTQGVVDRIDRLEVVLRSDRPDEKSPERLGVPTVCHGNGDPPKTHHRRG